MEEEEEEVEAEGLNMVVSRKFSAASPSSATWTVWTPRRRSCCAITCAPPHTYQHAEKRLYFSQSKKKKTHLLINGIVLADQDVQVFHSHITQL